MGFALGIGISLIIAWAVESTRKRRKARHVLARLHREQVWARREVDGHRAVWDWSNGAPE